MPAENGCVQTTDGKVRKLMEEMKKHGDGWRQGRHGSEDAGIREGRLPRKAAQPHLARAISVSIRLTAIAARLAVETLLLKQDACCLS